MKTGKIVLLVLLAMFIPVVGIPVLVVTLVKSSEKERNQSNNQRNNQYNNQFNNQYNNPYNNQFNNQYNNAPNNGGYGYNNSGYNNPNMQGQNCVQGDMGNNNPNFNAEGMQMQNNTDGNMGNYNSGYNNQGVQMQNGVNGEQRNYNQENRNVNVQTKGKTPRDKKLRENTITVVVLLIISIALMVVTIVADLSGIMYWLCFIFIAMTCVVFSGRKSIKRSYCPYCGEKYDYDDDISWEVSEVTVDKDFKKKANVEFVCECGYCGKETSFTQNFCIAYYDKGKDMYIEKNIHTEARKYFVK